MRTTINSATFVLKDATKYAINTYNCYKIDAPCIFAVIYQCDDYVLVHQVQGFDSTVYKEPKNGEEYREGLETCPNPFYVNPYGNVFDKISIDLKNAARMNAHYIGFHGDNEVDDITRDERFCLFKQIGSKELILKEFSVQKIYDMQLLEWVYIDNIIIENIAQKAVHKYFFEYNLEEKYL